MGASAAAGSATTPFFDLRGVEDLIPISAIIFLSCGFEILRRAAIFAFAFALGEILPCSQLQ